MLYCFCTPGYAAHLISCERWSSFVSIMQGRQLTVEEQMNKAVSETVTKNRQVLKSILDVVVTLGRQGLAFRGHRDSEVNHADPKTNSGNFYEVLRLRARGKLTICALLSCSVTVCLHVSSASFMLLLSQSYSASFVTFYPFLIMYT